MPLNSRFALPTVLGLSILSITSFVLYYIFKKEEDDDSKNTTKPVKAGRVNVIEVKVPKNIVPALIGRSGKNIKDIEQKTGALIHFKKFSDESYDVCIIRGHSDTSQLAETLIHDFINQQPVIIEDSLDVPAWACGRIIGTGGENINNTSHLSGARVKVEGSPNFDKQTTHRRVTFRGTRAQIDIAKRLVEECVAQEKCRREIELSKRSPRYVPTEHHTRPPIEPSGDSVRHVQYKRSDGSSGSIEVFVSAVSSPARFWVQFTGPQNAQLDELVAHMTEYYNDHGNREAHSLKHVSVGQVVAAVYRHDGSWYRARVHNIVPNEYDKTKLVADVFFVDYGDNEFVAVTELCELRADLLRLRFQAMECFLAGVKPTGAESRDIDNPLKYKWPSDAIDRFEDLAHVARWKPLVSKTCTYNQTATIEGEKMEIPGIKLYDITDEGELDIGQVLVEEGFAVVCTVVTPPPPREPFGDLGASRVLGMVTTSAGCSEEKTPEHSSTTAFEKEVEARDTEPIPPSVSPGSSLEKTSVKSISNFDLAYSDNKPKQVNGSHETFLNAERGNLDHEGSIETLVPQNRDDLKANMNRIDSHHGNLEALGRSPAELHK